MIGVQDNSSRAARIDEFTIENRIRGIQFHYHKVNGENVNILGSLYYAIHTIHEYCTSSQSSLIAANSISYAHLHQDLISFDNKNIVK